MIFDFFAKGEKSSKLIGKLDVKLRGMLKIFNSLESHYESKLRFIKVLNERKDAKGKKEILADINKILKSVGFEEYHEELEKKYAVKALDILKELLNRWRVNRNIINLTYQEYSNLNILHETLRNLITILYEQREWLKNALKDKQKFTRDLSEFLELVKQEGIIIGKEKELAEIVEKGIKKIEDTYPKSFTYSLVGYGSLMNADQVISELKETLEKAGTAIQNIDKEFKERVIPVWVVGYKRVFNKIATRGVWETEEDIKANRTSVLNVVASLRDKFNALAIKLTDDEYKSILNREKNYGVVELKQVYDYQTGQRLEERCICVKSDSLRVDVPVDKKERLEFYAQRIRKYSYGLDPDTLIKSNKMPIPRYIEVIDIGVRKLDALLGTVGMYDNYLNTTYCYYIDRGQRRDYGEIKLIQYYQLIGKEIERRLKLRI
jgi:hypothetical protein